jgi:hypothetical protein
MDKSKIKVVNKSYAGGKKIQKRKVVGAVRRVLQLGYVHIPYLICRHGLVVSFTFGED